MRKTRREKKTAFFFFSFVRLQLGVRESLLIAGCLSIPFFFSEKKKRLPFPLRATHVYPLIIFTISQRHPTVQKLNAENKTVTRFT